MSTITQRIRTLVNSARRSATYRGYRAYLKWCHEESLKMKAGKSRHKLPLTIKKWRRATGDKSPA